METINLMTEKPSKYKAELMIVYGLGLESFLLLCWLTVWSIVLKK